jgi:hypothetical protein
MHEELVMLEMEMLKTIDQKIVFEMAVKKYYEKHNIDEPLPIQQKSIDVYEIFTDYLTGHVKEKMLHKGFKNNKALKASLLIFKSNVMSNVWASFNMRI